ncbi:MAG: hypothetical protein AAFS10_05755 [Myxococcota bacterium]
MLGRVGFVWAEAPEGMVDTIAMTATKVLANMHLPFGFETTSFQSKFKALTLLTGFVTPANK